MQYWERDDKNHEDWEVEPWSCADDAPDFSLRVEEWRDWREPMLQPCFRVLLSNQQDCSESIDLASLTDFDDLIGRLQQAREWFARRVHI